MDTRGARAQGAGAGAGPCSGARRARDRVPAPVRHSEPAHVRGRGAAPLAAPEARPDRPRSVHPAGRGQRVDRADRALGAGAGLPPGGRAGRSRGEASCGSRSTCRRSSAAIPISPARSPISSSRSGLAARRLELEITERVLLADDPTANLETLGELKRLGVRISLDDFGIGHSSLGYLRRFPFDEIKLDRSFVGASHRDPSAQAILRAFLSLGRSLGLDAIAEGVESAEQLSAPRRRRLSLGAGLLFQPAGPSARDRRHDRGLAASSERKPTQDMQIIAVML